MSSPRASTLLAARGPATANSSHRIASFVVALCFLAPLSLSEAATAQTKQAPAWESAEPTTSGDAHDALSTDDHAASPQLHQNVAQDVDSTAEQPTSVVRPVATEEEYEVIAEEDQQVGTKPPVGLPRIFFNQRFNPLDYGAGQESQQPQGNMLQERHERAHTIRRRYTLFTQRNTKIQHKHRSHELDDELHSTLEVLIQFRQADEDIDRIDVTVLRAEPHVSKPASPLPIRVPSRGLRLHCWQRNFEVQCIHATSAKPVAWPQWATLDMNDWLPRRRVLPGARWRINLPDPRVVGWLGDDSPQGHIRASLEIIENGTSNQDDESRIQVQGVVSGDGELKVYHRRESFPINGELEIQFDNTQSLLHRFALKWDGSVNVEGLLSADKYRWTRQTHTTLRVTSSIEDAP